MLFSLAAIVWLGATSSVASPDSSTSANTGPFQSLAGRELEASQFTARSRLPDALFSPTTEENVTRRDVDNAPGTTNELGKRDDFSGIFHPFRWLRAEHAQEQAEKEAVEQAISKTKMEEQKTGHVSDHEDKKAIVQAIKQAHLQQKGPGSNAGSVIVLLRKRGRYQGRWKPSNTGHRGPWKVSQPGRELGPPSEKAARRQTWRDGEMKGHRTDLIQDRRGRMWLQLQKNKIAQLDDLSAHLQRKKADAVFASALARRLPAASHVSGATSKLGKRGGHAQGRWKVKQVGRVNAPTRQSDILKDAWKDYSRRFEREDKEQAMRNDMRRRLEESKWRAGLPPGPEICPACGVQLHYCAQCGRWIDPKAPFRTGSSTGSTSSWSTTSSPPESPRSYSSLEARSVSNNPGVPVHGSRD